MLQTRQLRLRERLNDCARARSQKVIKPGLRAWLPGPCSYSGALSVLSRSAPQEGTTPSLPPFQVLRLQNSRPFPPNPQLRATTSPPSTGDNPHREAPLGRMSAPSDGPKQGVSKSFFFALCPGTRVLRCSQHTVHLINHPDFSAQPNLASTICTLVSIVMKQL